MDSNCAKCGAEIYKYLKQENKMIDTADLLIGATALAHDLSLATLNIKDFERIPSLKLLAE